MENLSATASSDRGSKPSDEDVREALDRMMSHPDFGASDRRRTFLRFVVEEALAGRGRALKGFTIAQSVFDRDDSFDPKVDPVVRLEARRVRQDLDSYYVGPGANDPVRISIPKGGYAPLFEARCPDSASALVPGTPVEKGDTPAAETARGAGRKTIGVAMGVAGLAIIAVVYTWLYRTEDVITPEPLVAEFPQVVVLPFEALDPSPTTRTLSLGLSSELVLKLSGFDNLRLFAPLVAGDLKEKLPNFGADGIPAYVVRGALYTQDETVSINVQLLSGKNDELVWGQSYDGQLAVNTLMDLRDTVSSEIAEVLGQPYGPLINDVQVRGNRSHPESIESYLCVLRAYSYRRTFSMSEFAPVLACLEAAVARSPDYAEAWAMLGWLHLDAARYRFVPPDEVDAGYTAAITAAERAHVLAPDNVLAVKALSSIHHHLGNYAEGERYGRIALEMNPYDPDTLAQVGWRLSVRGKFDEGGPLMEQAIQRTVDPPGWYYHLPSLQHFMQGDHELALEEAEIAASKGAGFAWFLVAINAAALGDADRAATALKQLSAHPMVASDPEEFMRRHGATDAILNAAMAEYRHAQVLVSGRADDESALEH